MSRSEHSSFCSRVSEGVVAACLGTLLLVGSSCTDTGAPEDTTSVIDLANVPRLTMVEELRIGSLEDPDLGFSRVSQAVVDKDGLLYVLEAQDQQIRVYDGQGQLVRRIGGRGQGPGEFERVARFGVKGDTVWAVEYLMPFQQRFTLFSRDGRVIATGRGRGVPVVFPVAENAASASILMVLATELGEDGLFRGSGISSISGGRGMVESFFAPNPTPWPAPSDTVWEPRVRFDVSGGVVDTVRLIPHPPAEAPQTKQISVGTGQYVVPAPPSDVELTTALNDGEIRVTRPVATIAASGTFRLTRLSLLGDTVFSREFRYYPQPFGDESPDFDAMVWSAVRTPQVAPREITDSAAVFQEVRSAVGLPAFHPPVRSVRVHNGDRVWLLREDEPGDKQRWLVLENGGKAVGEIEVPRTALILWSAGFTFWAMERDQFGVPWVVRFRIQEAARSEP